MQNLPIDLSRDIYYQKAYAGLYTSEDGELFDYVFEDGDKTILFRSIKRQIKSVAGVSVEEELYDLETPYGYGGPLTNCYEDAFLKQAFESYRQHCLENKIVCEFIRFHPFNPMSQQKSQFDFLVHERTVVVVNLAVSTEERWAKYSKTTRNILRKAHKKLSKTVGSQDLDKFIHLYEETMNKNAAADFYYFKPEYFDKLAAIDGVELIEAMLDDEVVSSGFFMHGNEISHYHLSANHQNYLRENGNYLLLDYAFEQAKANGCQWMMLGGGRTSDENDSLFKFKSKFSDQKLPFYIAGIDFMPETRARLNKVWQEQHQSETAPRLFQLYRK
ncbi:GNAT family N-acetyltransferase [Photobacterium indicum]|uniref:GNAT family N-acetyltransferase n=1 Tax=Photobacterium indicum TaxID=81447 RepID=UPI003D0DA151